MVRFGFAQVVANAFAGLGFSAESPSVFEWPSMMFAPDSDLTPINENIDKIVYGLTEWEPKIKETGLFSSPKVTVTGKDYQEALIDMNYLFLWNTWGDGLPLLPATEERVNWILNGTDLPRDTLIGNIGPRGGAGTVEALAVSLAMAGGRPEYMPVLIAIIEAITEDEFKLGATNSTVLATTVGVAVSGPIANQVRINSGVSLIGPNAAWPAGGAIGRAMRLLFIGVGGAVPGSGTMSDYGGPMRYTGPVFAEDEAGLPEGWPPLSVDQGFPAGSNIVSCNSFSDSEARSAGSKFALGDAETYLYQAATIMRKPGQYYYQWSDGSPGFLLMSRIAAKGIADQGWSKDDVKKFLWENSKIPWSEMEKNAVTKDKYIGNAKPGVVLPDPLPDPMPITSKPENMRVVICGSQTIIHGHIYVLTVCNSSQGLISKEIKLPAKAKWDALLAQAEEDLGPITFSI
jgi:hypothetical protein